MAYCASGIIIFMVKNIHSISVKCTISDKKHDCDYFVCLFIKIYLSIRYRVDDGEVGHNYSMNLSRNMIKLQK